jgi:hypothetical protein
LVLHTSGESVLLQVLQAHSDRARSRATNFFMKPSLDRSKVKFFTVGARQGVFARLPHGLTKGNFKIVMAKVKITLE